MINYLTIATASYCVIRLLDQVHQHLPDHVPSADMDRVYLSGHSAGAHLVSLVALDTKYLDAERVPAGFIKVCC